MWSTCLVLPLSPWSPLPSTHRSGRQETWTSRTSFKAYYISKKNWNQTVFPPVFLKWCCPFVPFWIINNWYRVATEQGKQGIWFLLFPDRENTGNFAVTQGKFLGHRENIFDCIYHCKRHVSFTYFQIILASLRSAYFLVSDNCFWYYFFQYIYFPTFFPYHIGYKVSTKLIFWQFLKTNFKKCNLEYVHPRIFWM